MSTRLLSLPPEELPREKIYLQGRTSLNNSELLAIFLRTGIPGKNVIRLASDLISKAGSLEALAKLDAVEISKLAKGIGKAKAATLAAAFELGCRAIREEVSKRKLDEPSHVYDLLITETRWLSQEATYVLLVDAKLNLIRKIDISMGSLTETIAHPRDIFKPAIIHNAYGIILAHNHPSGSIRPSHSDDDATKRAFEAAAIIGIKLLDHIIIGKPNGDKSPAYYSYREHKRILH